MSVKRDYLTRKVHLPFWVSAAGCFSLMWLNLYFGKSLFVWFAVRGEWPPGFTPVVVTWGVVTVGLLAVILRFVRRDRQTRNQGKLPLAAVRVGRGELELPSKPLQQSGPRLAAIDPW